MTTKQFQPDELSSLRRQIDQFSAERDWAKFHTPKNLSMALTIEASELMEIFQWREGNEGFDTLPEGKRLAASHEVADVLIYLLRFCTVTGIDPIRAAMEKIRINEEKYPATLVRGKSDKYSEY